VERLTAPGGLRVGDDQAVTPATLKAFLDRQHGIRLLLQGLGINTQNLVPLTVSTVTAERKATAFALGGEVVGGNAGYLDREWRPGVGLGLALHTGQSAQTSRHLEVNDGARRIVRDPAKTSTGFGLSGMATTADGGRAGLGAFFTF
jgi:hypothetical protein